MSNIDKYLEKKGNSMVVLKPLKLIIPKVNFESDLASIEDTFIVAFGIFDFESVDGKDKFNCHLPLRIRLNFYNMKSEGDNYVFLYDAKDVLIEQMVFVDNVKEASAFLNLMNGAKIKVNTPSELVKVFYDGMGLNKINTSVPSELVDAMVSELLRWNKDLSIPFRIKAGTNNVAITDFTPINIKDIPRVSSVFSAISFEDSKKALQAAVYITRSGQEQRIGPIETVLHY